MGVTPKNRCSQNAMATMLKSDSISWRKAGGASGYMRYSALGGTVRHSGCSSQRSVAVRG